MRTRLIFGVALVLLAVSLAFPGSVAAQEGDNETTAATTTVPAESGSTISANPATPDTSAEHTIILSAEGNEQLGLTGVTVDYRETDVDISNLDNSSIEQIGIDSGGDFAGPRYNQRISDDIVNVTTTEKTLTVNLEGNYAISQRDEVVLVIDPIENPSEGEYDVDLDVNPNAEGGQSTATLTIGNPTTTREETPTQYAAGTGPGFGPVVAVAAILALALVAARRAD